MKDLHWNPQHDADLAWVNAFTDDCERGLAHLSADERAALDARVTARARRPLRSVAVLLAAFPASDALADAA